MDETKCDPITTIAHQLVSGNRQADYGHPLDNWCMVAVMASAIFRKRVTYKECLLFMASAVKTSREMNAAKRDNLIDGCGYLECLDMCYAEEKKRLAEGWTFDPQTGVWTQPTELVKFTKTLEDLGKTNPSPFDTFDPLRPWTCQPDKYGASTTELGKKVDLHG